LETCCWNNSVAQTVNSRQLQYSVQGINCDDPERKDMLMDIGTEELSHLEVVGALARLHLRPLKHNRRAAEIDPLIAIAGGGGVALQNSMGDAWTADYLKITGELDVDLRSNIAAEARAKIVYERLIQFTEDAGTIRALQFLMTREITHMKAFTAALESMGKDRFSIGAIPPTPGLVNQYFDDSTGTGDRGEPNARGPWNTGGDWEIVEAPAFAELQSEMKGTRESEANALSKAAGSNQ
jgi:Mn-containing catalase